MVHFNTLFPSSSLSRPAPHRRDASRLTALHPLEISGGGSRP
jgi:hypothetical protein